MVGWLEALADALWPARCVACGTADTWWCAACDARVVPVTNPACPACRRLTARGEYCPSCRPRTALTGIAAGAHLREPLLTGVKALKYRHAAAVARSLAPYLSRALDRLAPPPEALLVPVPLHPSRLRWRGRNQAAVLAKLAADAAGRPLGDTLRRTRNTPSQTGLGRTARQRNVAGAFRWYGPPARFVVLVDDIATAGATLDAAARACRDAGSRQVWGLVVGQR